MGNSEPTTVQPQEGEQPEQPEQLQKQLKPQRQVKSKSPKTAAEALLFTKSGVECMWNDTNEYSFRLRQIELLNYAVRIIAADIWREAEQIKFDVVHKDSMSYKSAFNVSDASHSWNILSEDPLFMDPSTQTTFFKDYQNYFLNSAGSSVEVNKANFQKFLLSFIRLRDLLLRTMSEQCPQFDESPEPFQSALVPTA